MFVANSDAFAKPWSFRIPICKLAGKLENFHVHSSAK